MDPHGLLTFGRTHMQNVAHLALFSRCDFHVILWDFSIMGIHLYIFYNYPNWIFWTVWL